MLFDIQWEVRAIPIESIDWEDESCRISATADPAFISALANSITQAGLLYPPLIAEDNKQRIIVSGFRRLAAIRRLGQDSIASRVAGPDTAKDVIARLAVAENAWQRPLGLMEKARALALLQTACGPKEDLAAIAKPLGLIENETMIAKLVPLVRLPNAIQASVESGFLSLAMAMELGTLDPQESQQLLDVFETFRFGLNRQREVMTLVREIARRESITIGQVLAADEINALQPMTDQGRPSGARALRRYLKKRRYPALTKLELEFDALKHSLGLGPRIRFKPPEFFEGTTYQLIMDFDSIKELCDHQGRVDKMSRHERLKRFFEG